MKSKRCCQCKLEKSLNDFHKNKSKPDGLAPNCKKCRSINSKTKYSKKIKEYKKTWYEENKQQIKKKDKERYANNKEEILAKNKEWRQNNLEKVKEAKREYYKNNKEYVKAKVKEYRDSNLKKVRAREHAYKSSEKGKKVRKKRYENKKDQINKDRRAYRKKRLETDVIYKLRRNVRSRLKKVLERGTTPPKSKELLGCDFETLKAHLEKQFEKGMSWDNYGEWHIDHIKPLCSVNFFDEKELKKVTHYKNLRPLWKEDNIKKSHEDRKLKWTQ